jgi:hypothetical protein
MKAAVSPEAGNRGGRLCLIVYLSVSVGLLAGCAGEQDPVEEPLRARTGTAALEETAPLRTVADCPEGSNILKGLSWMTCSSADRGPTAF